MDIRRSSSRPDLTRGNSVNILICMNSRHLKKHIINYAKTKEIYTAYRESGYSAKYYESNTESILLHQSSKRAFDSISSSKIPSVKDLQQEFNTCLNSKKVILKDYVKQKNLMKESLTVQSNVDHLFSQSSADKLEKER